MVQDFGGLWTILKLEVFRKYLETWLHIFHLNERARWYHKVYVDGFAGSGFVRVKRRQRKGVQTSFAFDATADELSDQVSQNGEIEEDTYTVEPGSASIALAAEPGFDEYILVDKSETNQLSLERLAESYSKADKCKVVRGDCNRELLGWVSRTDWKRTRALVFLDPYALHVEWNTLTALGRTEGVDLWLLFPLMGVQRQMPKAALPELHNELLLNRLFGDDAWKVEFYAESPQMNLFEEETQMEKSVSTQKLCEYLIRRLKLAFADVMESPIVLKTDGGAPLFCLVFAAANPKGAKTAIRIANDIRVKAMKER